MVSASISGHGLNWDKLNLRVSINQSNVNNNLSQDFDNGTLGVDMLPPITTPRTIYVIMADFIMHQDFMIFVLLLLITITFIGFIYGLCFIIGFCVKKVKKSSQQKDALNEEENDQIPTMIFHVIPPDNENGIGGSSENVSQSETFYSHELFAGRAQFSGRGESFH